MWYLTKRFRPFPHFLLPCYCWQSRESPSWSSHLHLTSPVMVRSKGKLIRWKDFCHFLLDQVNWEGWLWRKKVYFIWMDDVFFNLQNEIDFFLAYCWEERFVRNWSTQFMQAVFWESSGLDDMKISVERTQIGANLCHCLDFRHSRLFSTVVATNAPEKSLALSLASGSGGGGGCSRAITTIFQLQC